jgi:type II secretory pathway pseudopilin PulG
MTKPETRMSPDGAGAPFVPSCLRAFVPYSHPHSSFGFRVSGFRAKRGFTVIELLVVMGLIIILAGFLFYAYQHVVTDRKISDTKTSMQALQSLLGNYEQATHYQRPLPIVYATQDTFAPNPALPSWESAITSLTSANRVQWQLQFWTGGFTGSGEPAASVLTADALSSTVNGYPYQLADTICVMYAIESIPENAAILNSLPANLKKTIYVSSTNNAGPGTDTSMPVTLVLDGWGNPILFVPADGLSYVMTSTDPTYNAASVYTLGAPITYQGAIATNPTYTYTCINNIPAGTTGAMTAGEPPTYPASYPAPAPIYVYVAGAAPPNWGGLCDPNSLRPFWVSGGPDGDVTNARGYNPANPGASTHHDDDNIYSFSN